MTEPTPPQTPEETSFQALEGLTAAAAIFIGARVQLIDAGWTPANAELMTLEMARMAVASAQLSLAAITHGQQPPTQEGGT